MLAGGLEGGPVPQMQRHQVSQASLEPAPAPGPPGPGHGEEDGGPRPAGALARHPRRPARTQRDLGGERWENQAEHRADEQRFKEENKWEINQTQKITTKVGEETFHRFPGLRF